MVEVADREKLFQLDYAEVVGALSLAVPPVISTEIRLLIAGRIGKVRLIDNVAANVREG
jgi:pantothenate synthetase